MATKGAYNPFEDVKANFHKLPAQLQHEINTSPSSALIPTGYCYVTFERGSYKLRDQRLGGFLYRKNPELLRLFALNDLEVIRKKGNITATSARTYFFEKNGIRNSTTLSLIKMPTMSATLQPGGVKKTG